MTSYHPQNTGFLAGVRSAWRDLASLCEPISAGFGRLMYHVGRWSLLGPVISIFVHALILLIAALISVGAGQAGGQGDGGRQIDVAVITEAELFELEQATLDADAPAAPEMAESLLAEAGALTNPALEGLPDLGEQLAALADGLGGTGGEIGEGDLDIGGAGGGGAKFFGVEATGRRFAFIVDVSGSMRGPRIERLRKELVTAISGLAEHQTFVVILFSSDPVPLGGRQNWTDATQSGKQWAINEVLQIQAGGGTIPSPAFEVAFRMRPRPDAIYFMTDGIFHESHVGQIASMNRRGRTVPIHCITFEDRSGEAMMRRIASQSGGTYVHIEVNR